MSLTHVFVGFYGGMLLSFIPLLFITPCSAYYVVVVGWCLYYFFKSCIDLLPTSETESVDNWNTLQVCNLYILGLNIKFKYSYKS